MARKTFSVNMLNLIFCKLSISLFWCCWLDFISFFTFLRNCCSGDIFLLIALNLLNFKDLAFSRCLKFISLLFFVRNCCSNGDSFLLKVINLLVFKTGLTILGFLRENIAPNQRYNSNINIKLHNRIFEVKRK